MGTTFQISQQGMDRDALFQQLESYRQHDLATHGGRTWAYVYDTGRPDVEEIGKQAYMMYLSENALDPTVYPSTLTLETEVVRMGANHLRGDENVVGHFTSGGTESCMLAVKTARDHARRHKPHITEPEMVLPVTAHAAFHKAAHLMGVKKVLVPVVPGTYKADPKAMRDAITDNTVLMVGSAVSYAHGVIDPIPELGRIAIEKDVLFHVDGCIGAFLLPYYRRLGEQMVDFDFTVPGVTSISMDYHKYGYCPKQASVILFKDKSIRRHCLYACAEWTGYTVINPTLQSTKTAGPLAATWAVLNYVGDEGYMRIAKDTLDATKRIIEGIGEIDGIYVMGQPESSLVAFTSDEINVFHIIDEMKLCDWFVQPQLGFHGSKENVHLSVTATSIHRVDEMLKDLREAVAKARKLTEEQPDMSGMLEMLGQLDPATLTEDTFHEMMSMAGIAGTELPGRTAEINMILNSLSAPVAEFLLIEYFNELYA